MKPRYPVVLLDADGTLFDFERAERWAYRLTANQHDLPDSEDAYRLYSRINEELWRRLERREITKAELADRRFSELLEALELQGEPGRISADYRRNLGEGAFLLPGAEELCRELAPHCRLIIASNGITETQKARLAKSAIVSYIEMLIVSESGGADKPDPRFFEYLDRQAGSLDKAATLMVGDRLDADILGGNRFGVDTCWYNPAGAPLSGDILPTYTIGSLKELTAIVLG